MRDIRRDLGHRGALILASVVVLLALGAWPAAAGAQQKTFSEAELEQLLAPIALYPDDLLAQILMASTYPLDVVSAERWIKANPGLKGKALEDALQKQQWDASVKSLTAVPQVLTMMSEKLDWTQKLGDAFLAQREDVMATAQALRSKALAQGTLKDTPQQKVVTEKAETTTIVKIEPSSPEVVYVPTYNPTVVYGAWPYPAYPPYYYYPPGYAAGAGFVGFSVGVVVGSALWGGCNWSHGDVDVNVNRYNNFNRTTTTNANWQHNAERRGAVPYRDPAVAQRYNRGPAEGAQAREAYRGRSDAGAAQARANAGATQARADAGATQARADAARQRSNAEAAGTRSASAFDTGSGSQARDYSSRGASSLSSARASGMSGARAGGARGGGGRR